LVRKRHIEGALALHPGAFELGPSPSYTALNDEWFTLRFFPAAAFTTPITKHTLLSAAGQLVADDWARPWVQPTTCTGTQVLKMRHTCGATSADVHCIKYMYTNVAALSSMTVCRAPGSASPAEQQTLRRLCEGLGAVDIVAFPCHASLQLLVLAHRVVEGRLADLSPAGLSRALVADPRLLPVFEAAMGAEPARGWSELHRLAFPPPVDRRAPPAPRSTRSMTQQVATARARVLRGLGVAGRRRGGARGPTHLVHHPLTPRTPMRRTGQPLTPVWRRGGSAPRAARDSAGGCGCGPPPPFPTPWTGPARRREPARCPVGATDRPARRRRRCRCESPRRCRRSTGLAPPPAAARGAGPR